MKQQLCVLRTASGPCRLKYLKSGREVLEDEAKKVGWDSVLWGLEYQGKELALNLTDSGEP